MRPPSRVDVEGRPWAAKLVDLAAATPQLALYGAAIAGTVVRLAGQMRSRQGPPALADDLAMLSQGANAFYLSVLILLLIARRPPLATAPGIVPKLWATAGFMCAGLLILLPQAQMPTPVRLLSLSLTLGAAAASIWVVSYLGRSFSIFPQARRLVRRGPYRLIRHPLYLAESVGAVGLSLQFVQPWALIIAAAAIAAQFPRMHYEEQILTSVFPDYADYAARTSRLIPGIY